MEAPTCEDEAQYNIKYPIAAQMLFGNCGPLESSTTKMLDPRVKTAIEKIEFHHEPEYDKVFPAQRLSRVEVALVSGEKLVSGTCEPKGDHNADVSIEDIAGKIREINGYYAEQDTIDTMIESILECPADTPFEVILNKIKALAITNVHPELKFM